MPHVKLILPDILGKNSRSSTSATSINDRHLRRGKLESQVDGAAICEFGGLVGAAGFDGFRNLARGGLMCRKTSSIAVATFILALLPWQPGAYRHR